MSSKQALIMKAAAGLVLLWAVVFAVRSFASSKEITADRLENEIREMQMEDRSSDTGAITKVREGKIRDVASMVNRLDFKERERNRQNQSGEDFFNKLSGREKELFLDLTVVETMNRFIEALDQMPEAERKRFVERGLEEIQKGRTEADMERAAEMDGELLEKISSEGMRAYFEKASADTKLDLAPLMEAMNEVMQGLRGNEFGPR